MPASQQTGIRVDDAGGNGATNHDTTSHDKLSHADFLGNASTHLISYLSLSMAAQASSLHPSSLRKLRLPKLVCAFKQQAGAIGGRYKGWDNVT